MKTKELCAHFVIKQEHAKHDFTEKEVMFCFLFFTVYVISLKT